MLRQVALTSVNGIELDNVFVGLFRIRVSRFSKFSQGWNKKAIVRRKHLIFMLELTFILFLPSPGGVGLYMFQGFHHRQPIRKGQVLVAAMVWRRLSHGPVGKIASRVAPLAWSQPTPLRYEFPAVEPS